MHRDGDQPDHGSDSERPAGAPELRRPENATPDLEPDEIEIAQVKGGLKSPITYN